MSGLDLYASQRTLALLFVYAALTGFGLGVLYDGLVILRMALGEPNLRAHPAESAIQQGRRPLWRAILLFFEDVFFALASCIALILLCYYANDGRLRAPAVVGLIGGFFVYRHTVSRWVLRLAEWILGLVRRFIRACLRLVAIPLRGAWSLTVGRMVNARRERETDTQIQALTEAASRGFDVLGEEPKNPDQPV